MEIVIDAVLSSIVPPQDDFPWPHFVSMAIYNLLHHWGKEDISKPINLQEEKPNVVHLPPKIIFYLLFTIYSQLLIYNLEFSVIKRSMTNRYGKIRSFIQLTC